MTGALEALVTDPAAKANYPYDWRRPLVETAAELAEFAAEHLRAWRANPAGTSEARLVLVGHSMGGLLAWHAANCHLPTGDVAMVVTLGTPFGGSIKALRAIADGGVLPHSLYATSLRRELRRMPSIHDLLPSYTALNHHGTLRKPDHATLIACGADPDLVATASAGRSRLDAATASGSRVPLYALAGTTQPTAQSFTLAGGGFDVHESIGGRDWAGDGTVYFGAAYPRGGAVPFSLPQQHGALTRSPEAIQWVRHTIAAVALGPPQGVGIGLAVPELVRAGPPFEIRVVNNGLDVSCRINSAAGSAAPATIHLRRREGELYAITTIASAGLYTVTATGGSFTPITLDLLVIDEPSRARAGTT